MRTLKILIADNPDPVFILDLKGKIIEVNDALDSIPLTLVGQDFRDVVQEVEISATSKKAVLNSQWYDLVEKPFQWKETEYVKIVLKKPEIVPDLEHLQKMRDMIAVFLHRMRSPLTAMYGYAELIESGDKAKDSYLHKLLSGFDKLFVVMDELEQLHWLSKDTKNGNDEHSSETLDTIINDLLFNYGPGVRNRIQVKGNTTAPVLSDQKVVSKILDILITNAVEHTATNQEPVMIEVQDNNLIKITNGGPPIPEAMVKDLFYPFTTTKANSLGIGLTMAILYARQIGANIFLTENSGVKGISFTLCLYPS